MKLFEDENVEKGFCTSEKRYEDEKEKFPLLGEGRGSFVLESLKEGLTVSISCYCDLQYCR